MKIVVYGDDSDDQRSLISPLFSSILYTKIPVPTESIIILDSKGVTVRDNILGPYNEGAMINITCVAIGGKLPVNDVQWTETAELIWPLGKHGLIEYPGLKYFGILINLYGYDMIWYSYR